MVPVLVMVSCFHLLCRNTLSKIRLPIYHKHQLEYLNEMHLYLFYVWTVLDQLVHNRLCLIHNWSFCLHLVLRSEL